MKESDIDTLILGCTHYPLLRSGICAYMGEEVNIVNPAYETAMNLKQLLEEKQIAKDVSEGARAEYDLFLIHIFASEIYSGGSRIGRRKL